MTIPGLVRLCCGTGRVPGSHSWSSQAGFFLYVFILRFGFFLGGGGCTASMAYLPAPSAHPDRMISLELLSTLSGFIHTDSGIGWHLSKRFKSCPDITVLSPWSWHCRTHGNIPGCLQAGSSHKNALASSASISREKGKGSQATEKCSLL